MFISNAILYRIPCAMQTAAALSFIAGRAQFAPTQPTQEESIGWVPPRGEPSGALAESIAGQTIMAVKIEKRTVPPEVIDQHVGEAAAKIEAETGRKPGKAQRRELKDHARLALLPRAFPKAVQVPVWIDPEAKMLAVGTASQSQADDIVTLIVQSLGLLVVPLQVKHAPASIMAAWLHAGQGDAGFALGADLALRAVDESGETVRYSKAELDTDEVRQHLHNGKAVQAMGLYYMDRVDFVLTDSLALKKIVFGAPAAPDAPADAFDADVALATGELRPMLEQLIACMGGVMADEPEGAEA